MATTSLQPAWLTLDEAAQYLSVNERWLRSAIKSGRVPAYRTSTSTNSPYRLKREDLDAMFEANPAQSAAR